MESSLLGTKVDRDFGHNLQFLMAHHFRAEANITCNAMCTILLCTMLLCTILLCTSLLCCHVARGLILLRSRYCFAKMGAQAKESFVVLVEIQSMK